jgi:putative redox protein
VSKLCVWFAVRRVTRRRGKHSRNAPRLPTLALSMVTLALDWKGALKFENSAGSPAIELHSSTKGISSPPEALAYAVMACMAMDVVHVLEKARHELSAMSVTFEGERANDHPRRFVTMAIHFAITCDVEPRVVERAIELSRRTYCSVWNTLRSDIELRTTYTIVAPSP